MPAPNWPRAPTSRLGLFQRLEIIAIRNTIEADATIPRHCQAAFSPSPAQAEKHALPFSGISRRALLICGATGKNGSVTGSSTWKEQSNIQYPRKKDAKTGNRIQKKDRRMRGQSRHAVARYRRDFGTAKTSLRLCARHAFIMAGNY